MSIKSAKERWMHPVLLLTVLTLGCSFLALKDFVFGNHLLIFTDIGSDTKDVYLMVYEAVVAKIKNLDFTMWDFSIGTGANLFALQSIVFDPFALFIYSAGLLFGDVGLTQAIVYVYIAKILCSALACYWFLGSFSLPSWSKVAASFIYAFNGFLILWGQHYFMGTVCIFLPILLMCIEKSFQKSKWNMLLSIGIVLLICYSVYMAYMVLLFAAGYTLIRFFMLYGKKGIQEWRRLLSVGCYALLGLAMGTAILLPNIDMLLHLTGRVSGHGDFISSLALNTNATYYQSFFFSLFSNTYQGVGSGYAGYINYYEGLKTFFSLFFLFALPQYFASQIVHGSRKVWKLVVFLLFLYTICFNFVPSAFNAFTYPMYRFSFVLMPIFAIVTAKSLQDIFERKKVNLPALWVSLALIVAATAWLWIQQQSVTRFALLNVCVAAGIAASLLAVRKQLKIPVELLFCALFALVAVNVTAETYLVNAHRVTLLKSDPRWTTSGLNEDTSQALEYLNATDSAFYRVDKDYGDLASLNDAMVQGFYGVSTYNSMANKNFGSFVDANWPKLRYNVIQFGYFLGERQTIPASLLNVKYVLSKKDHYDAIVDPQFKAQFQIIKQLGQVYVLKNQNPVSFGRLYQNVITTDQMDKIQGIEREHILADTLEVSPEVAAGFEPYQGLVNEIDAPVVDLKKVTAVGAEIVDNSLPDSLKLLSREEKSIVALNINSASLKNLRNDPIFSAFVTSETATTFTVSYMTSDNKSITPINFQLSPGKESKISFPIPKNVRSVYFTYCGKEIVIKDIRCFNEDFPVLESQDVIFDKPVKSNLVEGTASVSHDSILSLSLPLESGWTVYIDGAKTDTFLVNQGLTGVFISQGQHQIKLVYQTPYLFAGAVVSACFCLLFVVIWILKKRGERNVSK